MTDVAEQPFQSIESAHDFMQVLENVIVDAQGELQGAVASLFSLSAIIGPPLMTHLFSSFSAPGSTPYVPGAAFFAATGLAFGSLMVFWLSTRKPVAESASASDSGLSAA